MFYNILTHHFNHRIIIKFIYILIIFAFLVSTFIGLLGTETKAAQYREKYKTGDLKNYPEYENLIKALQQAHPNWTFTILYTGLNWNTVIKNETTEVHGRNLIDGSMTGAWICPTCSDTKYDNGTWKCASEATVAYYMDPRNSLFEDYIFQFENLKWVDNLYTLDGIKKILSDCEYMAGDTITYVTAKGEKKTINKSYAQVIYDAGKEAGVSPYHLAARIRQEQGPGKEFSSTGIGTYKGYTGYYNIFNVKASGTGDSAIIKNALEYAKEQEWTDPEKSIEGGANFLAQEYISCGQNTLYLQKFDVDSSDGDLYWHQYMQNVSASKTEGTELLSTYSNILDKPMNFIIPVFENMPDTRCSQPGTQTIVTQNIEITDEEVVVRKEQKKSSAEVDKIKKGTKLLRIEIGNTKKDGEYWDKVVLDNGKQGYVISGKGFKVLEDISNCNIRAIAVEEGNVRNGPGVKGTTVITTLTEGQIVTIIEKEKYKNIDNYDWSRIYLSDGRQGYIVAEYLKEVENTSGSEQNAEPIPTEKDIVKVITSSGLSVRERPGTDANILKYAEKGDYLTRIDKEVSTKDGYIWDQVITDDGIEGYVARGDDEEDYLEVVKDVTPSTDIKGNGFKSSGLNIICEPNISVKDLKSAMNDAVVKNTKGKEVTSGNIGTGYTVKYSGQTYTVVKKGDTNGDGEVKATDYMKIKNYIMNTSKLTSQQKLAADVNEDGEVKSTDYMKIKNYIMGTSKITI